MIFLLPTVHTTKGLYLVWIVLSYFFYGGHYSIFPTVSARIYGPDTGAKVYPIIFVGFALSTIIGVVLAKVIIPAIQDENNPTAAYNPIFYAQGALTLVSLFLVFIFKEVPDPSYESYK